MVDRFNRTLEAQLSKFADHNQKDLDEHIPFLLMAYHSATHDTTHCSPVKMMLGRELKMPIDLMLASFPGPAQLSIAASDKKLGGAWERAQT